MSATLTDGPTVVGPDDGSLEQAPGVRGWSWTAWSIVPPVVAAVAARLILSFAAGSSVFTLSPKSWARWDSGNYLDIAIHGYYYHSCAGGNGVQTTCSNTPWYPAYPYLSRWTSQVFGTPLDTTAIFISAFFTLATLVLLWLVWLRHWPRPRALVTLLLAACFPGAVYYSALFPMAMFGFFVLAFVALMQQRRWWWAVIPGVIAGLVYPISVVLAPAAAVWMLLCRKDLDWPRRLGVSAAMGALVALGAAIVFTIHDIKVGLWDASLRHQETMGSHLMNPVTNLWDTLRAQLWIQKYPGNTMLGRWTALQSGLVLAILIAVTVTVLWRGRRVERAELGLLILIFAMWIFPLATSVDTGLPRKEGTLLPILLLTRRLPTPLVVAFTVVAMAVLYGVSQKFFDNTLI